MYHMAELQRQKQQLLKYMDFEVHERMLRVLKNLTRRQTAKPFLKPVDLPGYAECILEPMDLGTVQKHLLNDLRLPYEEKRYMVAHDFAHDVRLVFKNCFLFNPRNNPIFATAQKLCKDFEELFAEEERAFEASGPRCPLRARCQMLLTDLRRHPFTEWFRRAADWQGLPDYVPSLNR